MIEIEPQTIAQPDIRHSHRAIYYIEFNVGLVFLQYA